MEEMKQNPTVLSLFDGHSGAQISLVDLGIIPKIYYASEVDKFAIAQTQLNFPNTIQLGSVVNVNVSDLEHIDILFGGSPCQSFSFAGKRKGMATKCEIEIYTLEKYLELKEQGFEFEGQSYLFWEYMRILTEIRKYNPDVKFLLENVEMGKKWERILSEAIGLFPVHINSALVSAQNRKRLYWTNIRTKEVGMFGELHSDIPQPKDRGILLKDILENEVDKKYYLSDRMLNYFDKRSANFNAGKVNVRAETDKATTLCASMASCDISDNFIAVDCNGNEGMDKAGTVLSRYHKGASNFGTDTYIKVDKQLNPKANQDKASCFTAGGNSGGNHSDMDLICVAMRGRNPNNPSDRTIGAPTEQRLEPNLSGKTNCLTSVQKDNLVMCLTPKRTEYGKQIRKEYEAGEVTAMRKEVSRLEPRDDGKTNTLTTVQKDNLIQTSRIRRLTPTECARLQTVPDWYKWEFVELNYFGYICSVTKKTIICKTNVTPMAVPEQFQISQLDYATCTTLDLLELEKQRVEKLTKQKNVKLKAAIDMLKQNNTETYVSCITKDFIDTERGSFQLNNTFKNVSFVISKLEAEALSECAPVIIEVSNCMEIHLLLKKISPIQNNQLNQQDIMGVNIINKDTKISWSINLGDHLRTEKLSTILALVNWIIDRKIYTYAKDVLNIRLSIGNLNVLEQNYISVELSDLRMESIISCSDTQQYRMLGNGWTIEVIKHIIQQIP